MAILCRSILFAAILEEKEARDQGVLRKVDAMIKKEQRFKKDDNKDKPV